MYMDSYPGPLMLKFAIEQGLEGQGCDLRNYKGALSALNLLNPGCPAFMIFMKKSKFSCHLGAKVRCHGSPGALLENSHEVISGSAIWVKSSVGFGKASWQETEFYCYTGSRIWEILCTNTGRPVSCCTCHVMLFYHTEAWKLFLDLQLHCTLKDP